MPEAETDTGVGDHARDEGRVTTAMESGIRVGRTSLAGRDAGGLVRAGRRGS